MVRLTIVLIPLPRNVRQLVDALRSLSVGAHLEVGRLETNVWSDSDSTVHYVEEWATEADMRRRVRSEAFTSLLGVFDLAKEAPDIRFDFVASSRGLDYVEEVRRH